MKNLFRKENRTQEAGEVRSGPQVNMHDPVHFDLSQYVKKAEAVAKEASNKVQNSSGSSSDNTALFQMPWMISVDLCAGRKTGDFPRVVEKYTTVDAISALDGDESGLCWQWLILPEMVLIENNASLLNAPSEYLKGLLGVLPKVRKLTPANGLIVEISVSQLMTGDGQNLKELAKEIRKINEVVRSNLKQKLPLYMVVSGLENVDGFSELTQALPAETGRQAFGHMFDENGFSQGAEHELSSVCGDFETAMQAKILNMISENRQQETRRGLFFFNTQFKQVLNRLSAVLSDACKDDKIHDQLNLRGMYFVSTQAGYEFSEDLCSKFLPEDQPLATKI